MVNYANYLYNKYCLASKVKLREPKYEDQKKAFIDLAIIGATKMGGSKEDLLEQIEATKKGDWTGIIDTVSGYLGRLGIIVE